MNTIKTLVIGASPNPQRYSYRAVALLNKYGHQVEALGIRSGDIDGVKIQKGFPEIEQVHTITLYIGKKMQQGYYDYILNLNPVRIIFNPGTENDELVAKAQEARIETLHDCTLVMLNSGRF